MTPRRWLGIGLLVASSALLPIAARAGEPSPFAQGRWHLSAVGGGGLYGGARYVVLGAGVSVFALDGLEVGVEGEHWFGDPGISKVSPQIRYVLHAGAINPYAGLFYRHWFVTGPTDFDTVGARAGVLYASGGSAFFGLGAVYETVLSSCYADCSALYPELSIAFFL